MISSVLPKCANCFAGNFDNLKVFLESTPKSNFTPKLLTLFVRSVGFAEPFGFR